MPSVGGSYRSVGVVPAAGLGPLRGRRPERKDVLLDVVLETCVSEVTPLCLSGDTPVSLRLHPTTVYLHDLPSTDSFSSRPFSISQATESWACFRVIPHRLPSFA